MNHVVAALIGALKSLFHPKMLAVMLGPILASIALWLVASLIFWDAWVGALNALLQNTTVQQWMSHGVLANMSHYVVSTLLVLLLLPAIYVTALLITSIFAMPMMVTHVAQRSYPKLEYKHGGTTLGSVSNSVWATVIYIVGSIITLPLWLFAPLAVIVPVLLLAYINQRLFRYDALAEHASAEEYANIAAASKRDFFILGVAVGVLQFVPVLNLFLPIYAGLAFIHISLAELQRVRNNG